jgi:hypothetical protein
MEFISLLYEPRKLQATEKNLQAVYDAAKLGLKGDALALTAGMQPIELRQLMEFDPAASMAAQKGWADGEARMAKVLYKAAVEGDTRAALDVLKHQFGWVAKQQINVDIDQRISITDALRDAEGRVEAVFHVIEPEDREAV